MDPGGDTMSSELIIFLSLHLCFLLLPVWAAPLGILSLYGGMGGPQQLQVSHPKRKRALPIVLQSLKTDSSVAHRSRAHP